MCGQFCDHAKHKGLHGIIFLGKVSRCRTGQNSCNSHHLILPLYGMQRSFRAKEIPAHVKEQRYHAMMATLEAKRVAARVKADIARERARERLEQQYRAR